MPKYNQTSFRKGHAPLNRVADSCTLKGCDNKHEARGFCVKHYKRLVKYGDPNTPSNRDIRPGILKGLDIYIPLGINAKNGYAIINQQDKWVEHYFWHKTSSGYAAARIEGRLIMMHRFLLSEPAGGEVDHINRNKLDNRRQNLRIVDRSQNAVNTGIRNTNTSGYKGVSWSKAARKYEAHITHKGIKYYLGVYTSATEAHQAYLTKASELRA